MKKILISTRIGGLFNFLIGGLIYGFVFAPIIKQLSSAEAAAIALNENEMRMGYLLLSCFLGALLMAYIFVNVGKINNWLTGAKTGAIIGLLMASWVNSSLYSMSNYYTFAGMLFDVLLNTFMAAATGIVVAVVIIKIK